MKFNRALVFALVAGVTGFLSAPGKPQFEMKLSYRRVLEALSRGQEAP